MSDLPTTEKEFLEEILAILDETPHVHNPTRSTHDGGGSFNVCYYNKPHNATELSADHCAIGQWLKNKGYPIEELGEIDEPASVAFDALLLPFEWFSDEEGCLDFGTLADGVQSIVDSRSYPEAARPMNWGEAAKKIRTVYEAELR